MLGAAGPELDSTDALQEHDRAQQSSVAAEGGLQWFSRNPQPFAEQDTWVLCDGTSGSNIAESDASGVVTLPQQANG